MDLRCACGSLDLICIKPGSEPVKFTDLFDDPLLLDRGEAMQCWCRDCWPLLVKEEAAGDRSS